MIREHSLPNLLIGLTLSVLVHLTLMIWGLPLSLPRADLSAPSAVEVELRQWPPPTPPPAPPEAVTTETTSVPAPPAKPPLPPNTQALQEAVQQVLTPVRPENLDVQLPAQLPSSPAPAATADRLQLAEALRDSLQHEPQLSDSVALPDLPTPELHPGVARELPALPALEAPTRRSPAPSRPATVTLPTPRAGIGIRGPAAERQVIFQPPPPSATVESESDLELRFWILPNGTVGRIVPMQKSDPRLEALAINYLRHWRFSPLPSDVAQDEQWGLIPFKFRFR